MKKYFHEFPSKIPIYGGDFSLVITNDEDKCTEKFETGFEDGSVYAHALTRTREVEKNYKKVQYVIVLNPYYIDALTHGSIAHEANHITNWVMKRKGMEWDAENDEAQNYLLLYFVNLIYSHLEELKMLHRIKCKYE